MITTGTPITVGNPQGLVQFKSNAQIDEAERKKAEEAKRTEPVMTGLAGHIRVKWELAKRAKINIEQWFLRAKRQRNGEYEPAKLAAIKAVFGAEYDPVYMLITETKCRAAEAWIKDVLLKSDAEPWNIEPTPLPDLPKEFEEYLVGLIFQQVLAQKLQEIQAMQQAGLAVDTQVIINAVKERLPEVKDRLSKVIRQKAKEGIDKMREKLADLFAEGEWYKALDDLIFDLVTYGVAFMKGPVVVQGIERKRKLDPITKKWISNPEPKLIAKWMRRSPFDIYPASDSVGINDGFVIDKITLEAWELSSYIGVPGFNDAEIYACLQEYRNGGLKEWTAIASDRAHLENRDSISVYESEKIDCLHYMGSAQGQMLLDWGLSKDEIPDPLLEYKIDAFLIGRHIIMAMINPDPEGKKRLYKACFSDDPDSFWGRGGVPALIEDIQNVCNAIARAIVNNVAIASGPQVEVDTDRASGNVLQLVPWKIWRSTSKQMTDSQAIKFYMPQLVIGQLQNCYDFFLKIADEDSGIPRYAHGQTEVAGAGKTASGLSMLMTHSARGIKMFVKNLDEGIIEPSAKGGFFFILDTEELDFDLIGDCKIVAKGSSSLIAKEQQAIRRTEFLNATNNPLDSQIIGRKGRKYLLEETAKSLEIDLDRLFEEFEFEQDSFKNLMTGTENALTKAPIPTGGVPGATETTNFAGDRVAGQDFALAAQAKGGQI